MSTEAVEVANSRRWADASFLRNVQYVDASNFAARQSIYAYQQPRIRLYDWALDLAGMHGDETVLDVGCGNGAYLQALRRRGHRGLLVGIDFSPGMLGSVRAALAAETVPALVQGDAAALPMASASAEVALAMHMLYHVPDRGAALAELARVVRDGGVVLIVLNGAGHNAELRSLLREGLAARGLRAPASAAESFDLDAGERLASQYFRVERHEVRAQLVVPEPQPVLDYVRSMSLVAADGGDEGLLGFVEKKVSASIARNGAFRIATASGCLVCR
ncbi:MAG TPA: class I SAM-dependent methyltransferase [Acidimicrobiales bacterium]|nr:class I SAM-dependent methyltransferase [Acidimicrobiales bacterium]